MDPAEFFAEKAARLRPLLPLVREIEAVTRIARAAARAGFALPPRRPPHTRTACGCPPDPAPGRRANPITKHAQRAAGLLSACPARPWRRSIAVRVRP